MLSAPLPKMRKIKNIYPGSKLTNHASNIKSVEKRW